MLHTLSIVLWAFFSLSISHNSQLKHIAKDWCYVYTPGYQHLISSHVAEGRERSFLSAGHRGWSGWLVFKGGKGPWQFSREIPISVEACTTALEPML